MKQQVKFTKVLAVIVAIIAVVASLVAVSVYDKSLIWLVALTIAVILVAAVFVVLFARKSISNYFQVAAKHITSADDSAMNQFGIAMMIVNPDDEIVWYNEKFKCSVLKGVDAFGEHISSIFGAKTREYLDENEFSRIEFNNRYFNVFPLNCSDKYEGQTIYFFDDDTAYSSLKKQFEKSRPCVMFVHIDGLDLLLKNTPESKKNEILVPIERQIEELNQGSKGYIQKISAEKYFLLCEKENFDKILKNKFEVLSKVRNLEIGEQGVATLSIGVGVGGEDLSQCVEFANSALDMALGRGGDQAVVKNAEDFEFFGGVAESKPVNSAVRVRLVAQTLKKLIVNSENILIMGHSFSDMDAFGAAYGLNCAITKLGKTSNIVCNYKNTLAGSLLRYTARMQPTDDFIISPDEALPKIKQKTLLIVVDTHRSSALESEEVYKKCKDVVVIDHHRRTVDCIDNSILFYHDPSSSSTCEMVTELLRYFGIETVEKSSANALLSGIMLDTKNLLLRTTARTFETTAFLREKGADPVVVKEFFAETMETYSLKSEIVSSAKTIKNYAVAFCDNKSSFARISAAQAADELLTIKDVEASFVALTQDKGMVNISARSFGKVNVQVVMEVLGGGGHQTMAAAQVECSNFEDLVEIVSTAMKKAKENS